MKRSIAILAVLIVVALIAVFRGKSGEVPGVIDLTPSSNAGTRSAMPAAGPGTPSSGTPGGMGAPAPVGPMPAPSSVRGSSAREALIHSEDAKLVRGTGELGALNAHAQYVASPNSKALLAAAARVAVQAADCIQSGACAEAPPENRAYFDPENTAPHRLLAQSLRLMVDASNSGALADGGSVGEGKLFEIVRAGNEESRLLALELLLKGSPELASGSATQLGRISQSRSSYGNGHVGGLNPDLFDRILAERDHFQGESGRIFYSLLRESTDGSQVLRSHFMEALSDTWSNGDSETVLELVRHADQLDFTEQEYAQSVSKLCRFTDRNYPKANWRAIRHHLEKVRTVRGFQLGPSAICKA